MKSDTTLEQELDSAIDTCLHPERNALLIKEKVAEGASHEWLVKRELKTALLSLFEKYRMEKSLTIVSKLRSEMTYSKPSDERVAENIFTKIENRLTPKQIVSSVRKDD